MCAVRCRLRRPAGTLLDGPDENVTQFTFMTRKTPPENKTRIRQSPLPVIGVVVAVILLVFYGWSQRVWLNNVTDIESRDVDMQSRQLQQGFAAELEDLHDAVGDYSISD